MTIPAHFLALKDSFPAMLTAYDITPIRRFQCLPGRPIKGIYKTCTDLAYQFTATSKLAPRDTFVFHTGYSKGKELLNILGRALPPLETWEVGMAIDPAPVVPPGPGPRTAPAALCDFNARLLELLNLFFLRHDFDPTKPSAKIFLAINKAPGTPYYQGAKALNTVLLVHKETAARLVAWLTQAVSPKPVRGFDFSILRERLQMDPNPPPVIAI